MFGKICNYNYIIIIMIITAIIIRTVTMCIILATNVYSWQSKMTIIVVITTVKQLKLS